jgi:hypothetical protein
MIINNPVIFNNNYLEAVTGLTVLATDPYKTAKRHLSISEIARSHRSRHNSGFYNQKQITVRVGITRATRALLETSIDSLNSMLDGINKILELPQGGQQRQYYCTYEDVLIEKDGASYIEMSLIFDCTDKFGYNKTQDTLLSITSGYTSQSRSDRLTFAGSAPTQVPVIRLTYSALTSGTSKAVRIGNGQSGQEIVITRTWAAGDFIEIDSFNKTVKVNNIDVAFTGAIPEWANGDTNPFGYWYYFDNLGSRTFTGTITYYKRYK